MSLQVQELIEKIKKEGIQEAEQKARGIESEAKKQADKILQQAREHAQKLVAAAEQESKKTWDATRIALKQAARDTVLNLRKEIEGTLHKIIAQDVGKALTPDTLAHIIRETVKGYLQNNTPAGDIVVTLNSKDLKHLKDGFVAELKDKVRHSLTLKSADDIGAGFTISFDSGKSCFDFTDASLAQYLAGYLNAEVAALLKEAV